MFKQVNVFPNNMLLELTLRSSKTAYGATASLSLTLTHTNVHFPANGEAQGEAFQLSSAVDPLKDETADPGAAASARRKFEEKERREKLLLVRYCTFSDLLP